MNLGYIQKNYLARYDVTDKKWVKEGELPSDLCDVTNSVLAAYNGDVYFIGGYLEDEGKVLSSVYRFDLNGDASAELVWSSANTKVAKVDQNGNVTAVKGAAGRTVKITVTSVSDPTVKATKK